jgi:EPS-associated MarR family transcriptional regulator
MNKLFTTAGIEEEIRPRLLKMVDEADGELTQREMARRMGISPGKTNYCLLELVKKGLVKAEKFKNSRSKAAYAYWLTPAGFEEKVRLTVAFLARKRREYEILEKEIAELQQEVRELETTPSPLSRNGSR